MDYNMLTDGTPTTKPQAQWVCNTITANSFIGGGGSGGIQLPRLIAPPAAPTGSNVKLYADSTGNLNSIDSGSTNKRYFTTDGFDPMIGDLNMNGNNIVGAGTINTTPASSLAYNAFGTLVQSGNFPKYADVGGQALEDSKYSANSFTKNQYAQNPIYGPHVRNSISTLTLLNPPTFSEGSLTVAAPFYPGASIHITTYLLASALAGSSCSIAFLFGGSVALDFGSPIVGPLTNALFKLDIDVVSGNGGVLGTWATLTQSGVAPTIFQLDTLGFVPTDPHIIDLIAQWNVASFSNDVQCGPFIVTEGFEPV